jgi:hypothetical protein
LVRVFEQNQQFNAISKTMAKAKYLRSPGKKLSTVTLIFWTLFMLTLVIIVLLALGIVYLPNTSDDSSTTTDLSGFRRKTSERWFDFDVISFYYFVWFWFEMCLIFRVLWLPFLELVSVWRKGRSSGLKFFHGSQELSSITIFWSVFVIISWI